MGSLRNLSYLVSNINMSDKFSLLWKDFDSCTRDTFKDLLSDQDFTDVTLACEDDKQLKAHKAILSSCSPFFKRILKKNPHQHPLIYLKGMVYANLEAIIQFMYLGQTEVGQKNLGQFMSDAKELEVKGLTDSKPEFSENIPAKRDEKVPLFYESVGPVCTSEPLLSTHEMEEYTADNVKSNVL